MLRSSRSIANTLAAIDHRISNVLNGSFLTRATVIDISKTSDNMQYSGLLYRLSSYGVRRIYAVTKTFSMKDVASCQTSEAHVINAAFLLTGNIFRSLINISQCSGKVIILIFPLDKDYIFPGVIVSWCRFLISHVIFWCIWDCVCKFSSIFR